MTDKVYKTRLEWHNVKVVAMAAPFMLSGAAGIGFSTGHIKLIGGTAAAVALALIIAFIRDRKRPATYRITEQALELERGRFQDRILAADIIDASMMERVVGRHYVQRKVVKKHRDGLPSPRETQQRFLRYCTIDIGLRSFTFGLGRLFIDRMESSRHDLILLRAKDGVEFLLSPERNQDFVEQISKLKRRQEDGSAAPIQL